MSELPSTEFREHLFEPLSWVVFLLLGLLFVGVGVVLGLSWIVPERLALRTGPATIADIAMSLVMIPGSLALGGAMLTSTLWSFLDYQSATIEHLQISIDKVNTVRDRSYLHFRTPTGRHESVGVPHTWAIKALPQTADLWRTSHGRRPLKLRLHQGGIEYSVLAPPS